MGTEAKGLLSNTVCPDDNADNKDLHMQMIDLVFSEEGTEAEKRLIHSITEMDNGLKAMDFTAYDLDALAPTLLDVYDYQQQKYIAEDTFSLFSFVGMAFN